jgi:hypothetical protein
MIRFGISTMPPIESARESRLLDRAAAERSSLGIGTVLPPGAIGDRGNVPLRSRLARGRPRLGPHLLPLSRAPLGRSRHLRLPLRPGADDARCTTIWCFADKGVPWTCIACRQPISGPSSDSSSLRSFFVKLPANIEAMTEAERLAAFERIARDARRQLGSGPWSSAPVSGEERPATRRASRTRPRRAVGPDASPVGDSDSVTTGLRVRDKRGRVIIDASIAEILAVIAELGAGNDFIVIDRLGRSGGSQYAQALRRADGRWVIEYREGTLTRHYQTLLGERAIVDRFLSAGPWRRRVGETG